MNDPAIRVEGHETDIPVTQSIVEFFYRMPVIAPRSGHEREIDHRRGAQGQTRRGFGFGQILVQFAHKKIDGPKPEQRRTYLLKPVNEKVRQPAQFNEFNRPAPGNGKAACFCHLHAFAFSTPSGVRSSAANAAGQRTYRMDRRKMGGPSEWPAHALTSSNGSSDVH